MKKILTIAAVLFLFSFTFQSQEYKIENNELILPSTIDFKKGTSELLPGSDSALNYIKLYLKEKTYITLLRIEGHTDNSNKEEINQTLSEKRALAVGKWFENHEVDCNRLICVGFGSSKPKVTNETAEGRALNERISVYNVEMRKVRIGGLPSDGGGKKAGDACK
ncbi:MAG: OmpA family protein [bacterium]|nr:OmpA family protein [bacterium]